MLVHDRFGKTNGDAAQALHPRAFAGFIHLVDTKRFSA
jgi:hypothetical protein